jgi:WD40 repeat protein
MPHGLPVLCVLLALSACPVLAEPQVQDNPALLAKLPGPAGTDVAWSQDGKLLLTAGGDQARVWDADTYKPVTKPLKHEGRVPTASLSPDGELAATAWGAVAKFWSTTTGEEVFAPLRHPAEVTATRFSDDGRLMATTARDGAARVWEVPTGRLVRTFKHDAEVVHAAFAPRGARLLTSVQSGGSTLWDLGTGKVVAKFDGVAAVRGSPAVFSPTGDRVATAEFERAHVWDGETGRRVMSLMPPGPVRREPLGPGQVNCVAFSPDGTKVLTAGMGGARLWDARDGRPLDFEVVAQWIEAAAFSPDGRHVLTVDADDGTRVWNWGEDQVVLQVALPSGGRRLPVAAFNPTGTAVAVGFASDGFTGIYQVEKPGDR